MRTVPERQTRWPAVTAAPAPHGMARKTPPSHSPPKADRSTRDLNLRYAPTEWPQPAAINMASPKLSIRYPLSMA